MVKFTERRNHKRDNFTSLLEYRLIPPVTAKAFRAMTVNVGASGFCSYLGSSVSQGQKISIKKSNLPFVCKKAVVRWVIPLDDIYMAGFECVP